MINKKGLLIKLSSIFNIRLSFVFFILLSCSFIASAAQQNKLQGVRAWPSPDNTRIVLDLSQKPNYETHYLSKPDRLVIDLFSTANKTNLSKVASTGPIVKNIRESGSDRATTFRLVVDLKQASKANIFSLPPAKPYGHRLVIDLPHAVATSKTIVPPFIMTSEGRNIIIAIDAGHGGDDPGALGKYTYEKKVTLQIAKRLRAKINAQKGMSAFLVRTGDYFVNLNKRSVIARKGKADFLVSIHADGFTSSQPRGASVWVLSNRRATSELGRWMEKHEAHSELLGGAGNIIQDSDSVPFLNKMLLDMSMGNTMDVGYAIGDLVTKELSKVTKMHKSKPVHASLAVLKSPDIPSILVEAGFITNRTEERLLNQADFQNKIANAVYKGIYKHFTNTPPQGSLFAQKKRAIKHTVRSGESLSLLAQRYSVSSVELKEYNHLKSNALRVGQVLSIPPDYHVVVKSEPVVTRVLPVYSEPQKTVVHVVRGGESLSVIANRYKKTTGQLKSYNNLRSTSLAIGQKIKIPGIALITEKVSSVVQAERRHKVKRGESLSVIAQRYGSSSNTLKKYNKLKSTSLSIGQTIKIPGSLSLASLPERVHRVKRGESLSVIASRYNSTTAQLKNYNKLRSTSLKIGQKLKIPGTHGSQSIVQTSKIAKPIAVVRTPTKHTVKRGESLSVIAQRYDRSSEQFIAYNKLHSTTLAIGQSLKIPTASYKVVKKPALHIVRSGQSLSVIAQRYGITSAQLKRHNRLRSSTLMVGQKLKIPNPDIKETKHKVRSGESLSVIAQRYGTTTRAIVSENKLRSKSLAIGQVLTIPVT